MVKRMLLKLGTTIFIVVMVISCIKESGIDQSFISAWNQFTQSDFLEKMTDFVDLIKDFSTGKQIDEREIQ